jgi:hypothetical protein
MTILRCDHILRRDPRASAIRGSRRCEACRRQAVVSPNAVHPRPLAPGWIILAMAAGLAARPPRARPGRCPVRGGGRRHLAPDRARPARDDVPGPGQGPLRPPRHGHRRPPDAGLQPALNWVLGPALMFALAWLLLPDLPEYRTGLIIVGLARCIAMVIIWNDLACGDREAAAVLVALNSVFQVIAFAALGWFYLSVLPGWLGLPEATLDVSPWQIAKSVLIFLGIPLLAGYLSRRDRRTAVGASGIRATFLPRIGPWALYGLLFTIVVLFALQGDADHQPPARRRPHRAAAAGLLRAHVGRRRIPWARRSAWATNAPRRSPSPPPATTSSWPSRSPSRPSAWPPGRPSRASSGRSSRCPCWWAWSTSASRCEAGSSQRRGHREARAARSRAAYPSRSCSSV